MFSFGRAKLAHRFAVLIGLFSLGFIIYGAWSFKTLGEVKVTGRCISASCRART